MANIEGLEITTGRYVVPTGRVIATVSIKVPTGSDPQQHITYEDFDQWQLDLEEHDNNAYWQCAFRGRRWIQRPRYSAFKAQELDKSEEPKRLWVQFDSMSIGQTTKVKNKKDGVITRAGVGAEWCFCTSSVLLMLKLNFALWGYPSVTSPQTQRPLALHPCVLSVKSSSLKTKDQLASASSLVEFENLHTTDDQGTMQIHSKVLLRLNNAPVWKNVENIPSFVPRPAYVPAGSRNRPTSVPAGRGRIISCLLGSLQSVFSAMSIKNNFTYCDLLSLSNIPSSLPTFHTRPSSNKEIWHYCWKQWLNYIAGIEAEYFERVVRKFGCHVEWTKAEVQDAEGFIGSSEISKKEALFKRAEEKLAAICSERGSKSKYSKVGVTNMHPFSYSAFDHDHDILVESRSWILQLVSEPRGSQSRIIQGFSVKYRGLHNKGFMILIHDKIKILFLEAGLISDF
ncbi:hypothetical protein Tco_0196547 [Tanacetum coccineum]